MASKELMPIAIVGMSCRLPGDVSTPGEFWRLLSRGRSGWSKIPKDRFNSDAYSHPNPEKRGTINSQGGYFISQNLTEFDPGFFDMTKKEAETMDPTQRLLLECTYEAFENAGMPKEMLSGKKMGVFIGGPDNEHRMGNLRDLDDAPMFDPTGSQGAFLAGRIAYYFNLRGPTFTLDTACSSSMTALHLAVQSIRSGESDSAMVGASHLITQPDVWVSMAKLRLFADSGRTYAFDHRAKSGYARGEGVGCIVLKPLDQALADKDHIRAVIAHTGISHNGRTVGIVAPSSEEQERLVRDVLSQAHINPQDVGFFEAHGTGTKVGDPIEATAIHKALGKSLSKASPLHLGSVKTNVGHLENASGLISVMKAALMIEKGFVVPNADFERENPAIPLNDWNMRIPKRQLPWPRNKRYICVNNFGYSGSNGHAVLQAAPSESSEDYFDVSETTDHFRLKRLFVLSGNDETAVRKSMEKMGIFLEQHAELYQTTMPRNLSYTLCQRRSHLPWRVAVVSDMCSNFALALHSPDAVPKRAPSTPPKIAFVFTGQGAQWYGMGRELLSSHPVFFNSVKRSTEHLLSLGADFSLMEELTRPEKETRVGMAHISQPICSAVQIGLVDLLASWGIKPTAVTGHSSGEIGAAYATGALTLEGAMSAAYHRGQAIIALKKSHPAAKGAMMAVGVGLSELEHIFEKLPAGIAAVAACENSPSSTTVSGDVEAVDQVAAALSAKEIFNRKLFVDVAYHSPHMKLISKPYYNSIADIKLRPNTNSNVSFFSSLRGRKVSTEELGPQYWVDNLTNPVRFATALQILCREHEPNLLIEIGPHAALKGPIMQTLKTMKLPASKMPGYLPSLVRGRDASETCMELSGELFMRGYEDLNYFAINHEREHLETPELIPFLYTYPFSRQKCWYESRITKQHRLKPFARHDLLGTLADWSSELEPTWRNIIRLEDIPWLHDFMFMGRSYFPLSAFMSMAIEAANQRAVIKGVEATRFELRDVVVSEQLWLTNEEPVEILLNMRPSVEVGVTGDGFQILTYDHSRGWQENCRGFIQPKTATDMKGKDIRSKARWYAAPRADETTVPAATFYLNMAGSGVVFPASFWNLVSLTITAMGASAHGCLHETSMSMPLAHEAPYLVHPATLDSLVQLANAGLGVDDTGVPTLPTAVKQVRINLSSNWERTPGSKFYAQTNRDEKTGLYMAELFASPKIDLPSISFLGLQLSPQKTDVLQASQPRELCYKTIWEPVAERQANGVNINHVGAYDRRVVVVTESSNNPLVGAVCQKIEQTMGVVPAVSALANIEDFAATFVVMSELSGSLLTSLSEAQFKQVQQLLTKAERLLWVTQGATLTSSNPSANMALGLLRTIRSELAVTAATLDLDPASKLGTVGQAELIEDALSILSDAEQTDREFAEQNGKLVVPRFIADEDMNVRVHRELGPSAPYEQSLFQHDRPLQLAQIVDSSPDDLFFEDLPARTTLNQNELEIEVKASLLSRDDLPSQNQNSAVSTPERSCSGIVTRVGRGVSTVEVGDRVCALASALLGTHVRVCATSAVRIPVGMSFESAALIPSVFTTGYYALAHVARVDRGEHVFVHMSGGASLAAIHVAQYLGAEVFVIVDQNSNRETVAKTCGVDLERVLDATSMYFTREVSDVTQGCGADVVFTMASDSAEVAASKSKIFDAVASFGRIVEVSTGDNTNQASARPSVSGNVTFTSINMPSLAASRPLVMEKILQAVTQRYEQGMFRSLSNITALPMIQLQKGMEMVQRSSLNHIVIAPKQDENVKVSHAVAGSHLNPKGTHVIIGGTGGLGRSIARWMVHHGATSILLLSRSGGGKEVRRLAEEVSDKATITVKTCDVASETEVRKLVSDCAKVLPPICGIVQAAMVLQDGLFEEMTHEAYMSTVRSKVDGTWNMHNALESAGASLDYFVLFSSAAGILGSRGQAAYAAANTFLDAFAQFRVTQGLPAMSLDLTAVTGAGYIAENGQRAADILKNFGGETVSEEEVISLLTVATLPSALRTSQILTGLKLSADPARGGLPYYAEDARFSGLKAAALSEAAAAGGVVAIVSYRAAFKDASGNEEKQREVASEGVLQKLSEVLSVPRDDVDSQRSMASYGLDSLTAIEIRNWITRELGANLQILELLTSGCVNDLAGLIVSRVKG